MITNTKQIVLNNLQLPYIQILINWLSLKFKDLFFNANGLLTNKNRVNIVAGFTAKSLTNNNIYLIEAMYYNGTNPLTGEKYGWILSDNTIRFKFDDKCNSTVSEFSK